jgi:hypothetical protein
MNSSTSNSEPALGWRRFVRRLLFIAALTSAAIYGFIMTLDPFDTLILSPPFDRSPVASNQRYAFPALARRAAFDSVILGTSTSRSLQPIELDPLFGAHFVNLAMNSATAYEQWRLGMLFARRHREAKVALIGLDVVWCRTGDNLEKYTERAFPEWMYDDDPWNDYLEHFNLYALEQAGIEFGVLLGLVPHRYGSDGYTPFLPDDRDHDLARARAHLYPGGAPLARPVHPPVTLSAEERNGLNFPALPMLSDLLAAMPHTLKILYFVPYHITAQPTPGSRAAAIWAECKDRVATLTAGMAKARVVDFMIASPITATDENYWDPLHYRESIAHWLASSLRAAADGAPRAEVGFAVR